MIHYVYNHVIPAAYSLLPKAMDSRQATMMLLAIGQHESAFRHRRQQPGPARGLWQFELYGGVKSVLEHHATKQDAHTACRILGYRTHEWDAMQAIQHNDVLACIFARLLLWSLPQPLPVVGAIKESYAQYIEAWRPGKPRSDDWEPDYRTALSVISQ